MAYIDLTYYNQTFKGTEISSDEFDRLADIASDIIDSVSRQPIDSVKALSAEVKKATAYEVEMLNQLGGIDAITGLTAGIGGGSESLGGYSVSSTQMVITKDGLPVSSMSIALLRKAGLMSRWPAGVNYAE